MPEPITPLTERPWEDVERMLDVDAAMEKILAAFAPLDEESVTLYDAAGRVLSGDIVADSDVPPFRNAAMDGYAVRTIDVRAASWTNPIVLPITGTVAAGANTVPALEAGGAIRIMTGAPLPQGADAVVRFEETDERDPAGPARSTVAIFRPPALNDNVREAGEDVRRGTIVAKAHRPLSPPDLGLIASVGMPKVRAYRRPRVAILSTGDELSQPGDALPAGAIRDSNSIVLAALARSWGAEVQTLGIARDAAEELSASLRQARGVDLIVTSGGVSLGDYDLVKNVLRANGQVEIWQVRMKPGKPLAFGHLGKTPLLGLPGNPVAAAVSFIVFGKPVIRLMLGDHQPGHQMIDVTAAEAMDNRGQRRHFVRVSLRQNEDGTVSARGAGEQGAGILSSLALADALMIVPETVERVTPGTKLQAIPLDWARSDAIRFG